MSGESAAPKIALVQPLLAHYRMRLFALLDHEQAFDFMFVSGGRDMAGVARFPPDLVGIHVLAPIFWLGPIGWQRNVVRLALSNAVDALIVPGDPHYLSAWVAAFIARLRGKPVLFWTHGWRRPERGLKRLLRLAFYRLADRLLVYSERGKRLGVEAGYPGERITVIFNSLDLDRADAVIEEIGRHESAAPPAVSFFADPARPLLICTARLTQSCRFDVLLRAAALMRDQGRPANILLVGDGPMRSELAALAQSLEVDVHFTGAVYDEEKLGSWLYHADVTVSPGKVGLTAVHSMMYGTPVITHRNFDAQMPEVETIIEGETGAFFDQGDEHDLARSIATWLDASQDRAVIRERCRAVIQDKWSPGNQARLIVESVGEMLDHKG